MPLSRRDLLLRTAGLGGLVSLASLRPLWSAELEPGLAPARVRSSVARYLAESSTEEPATRLATVYFHWFAVEGKRQIGQVPGPGVPVDELIRDPAERGKVPRGMLAWNGSVRHHRRHDLALLRAGFDTIIFQIPLGYPNTQRNHLSALRQLKDEGVAIPKLVPFVEAASYYIYYNDRDFHDPDVRERLYQRYATFFDRHFAVLGPEDLVWKDGRVFVHQWWVPGIDEAPVWLFEELSDRCFARYGFRLFVSAHEYAAHANPDRVDKLFNGVQPWRRDRDGNYSLLPGFFPPSVDAVKRGYFVPRRNGATYREAWDAVIEDAARRASPPEWLVVESANEIGECTSILPLVEAPRRVVEVRTGELCTARACIPPGAKGLPVELGADPLFYLDATADGWRRFRERLGLV